MTARTRTLFLHVGPAKTGTSAIQDVLRSNRDCGVFYPKTDLWADGAHHNLILNFMGNHNRPELVRRDAGEMLDEIGEEARKSDRDILISSEILAGAKDIGRFIEACRSRWKIEPLDVKIVVICREHFERASSLYNQRVKDSATMERESADDFLAERANVLLYAPMIKRFEKTGAEVLALNYHPARNMVKRFLRQIGGKDAAAVEAHPRNVSLSVKGLVSVLAANRISANASDRDQVFSILQKMEGFFGGSKFIFGRAVAKSVKQTFAQDREFLRSRFEIKLRKPVLKDVQNDLFLWEKDWNDIARVARKLGGEREAFLAEAGKFRQLAAEAAPAPLKAN